MIFAQTSLQGVYLIDLEKKEDDRGYFARTFCKNEFASRGLAFNFVQCNVSHNDKKGTIRGMHLQKEPHQEAKTICCIKGAIYDVVIDLRRDSATYCQWLAAELRGDTLRTLYIPEGCAHGFQTLKDDTLVYYQMSEFFHPECAVGLRWDDPMFKISWPLPLMNISSKDKAYADYKK
jgi:dTDP-4-dehydrorhamnose 3,5-epimerase